MKVLPFTIPKPKRDSLILQENLEPSFYGLLHQHEEFQISLILEGEGTLIVGDLIHNYQKGDVFIFNENLPHVFRSNPSKIDFSHSHMGIFTHRYMGQPRVNEAFLGRKRQNKSTNVNYQQELLARLANT